MMPTPVRLSIAVWMAVFRVVPNDPGTWASMWANRLCSAAGCELRKKPAIATASRMSGNRARKLK
jgi:hypothetical protein